MTDDLSPDSYEKQWINRLKEKEEKDEKEDEKEGNREEASHSGFIWQICNCDLCCMSLQIEN